MSITATSLRQNLYNILDEIIETGKPVEITRKGITLKIIPEQKRDVFEVLENHSTIIGNPEDIIHNDFSGEWNSNL